MVRKKYVTLKDIAEMLGVSVTTVHKAIKGHPDISPKTRKKVLSLVDELGYIKNETASNLRQSQSNTIAFIVSGISNPFYELVIKGMTHAAKKYGYVLLITNLIDNSAETIRYNIENLLKKRIDGFIIAADMMNLNDSDYKKYRIKESSVAFGTVFPSGNFDIISPNNFEGGYVATEHLIDIGCKKIAMLHASNFKNEKKLRERFQGYVAALKNHGIEFSKELVFVQKPFFDKSYDTKYAYQTIKEKLETTEFDGLFCYNDEIAYGAIEAIKEKGLRIPEDIAVVGYDDLEFSHMISPSLTSITFDKYKLGYRAVEMLIERINNPAMDLRTELIEIEIVVRESTSRMNKN